MPIRLNLLAEAQAAEDMRRRDPVKRVMIAGALIVALMVAGSSLLEVKVMMANSKLSAEQFQIDQHADAYQTANTNTAKIATAKTKIKQLEELTDARLLQGNLLNALQKVSVDNVQLTGIKVNQTYQTTDKPSAAIERIVVVLNARDSSANPGDQVGRFKDALAKQAYFRDMLDKTNAIRLTDESSPQQDSSGKDFVSFTLECHFPDHKR